MITCCFWSRRPLTAPPRWTWALSLCKLCWSSLPPDLLRGGKGPGCKRHACPPARWQSLRPRLRKQTFHAEASLVTLTTHEALLFVLWSPNSGSSTWLWEWLVTGASRVTERAEEAWREAGEHCVAMGILRKTYSSGISCAHDGKIRRINGDLLVDACGQQEQAWFLLWWLNGTLWFLMKHSCNLKLPTWK